jgi:hypothetical protein
VTVTVRRACVSAAFAERLRAAVAADTPDYVAVTVAGSELRIRLTAPTAASARATLEDLLACLKAAEGAAGPG